MGETLTADVSAIVDADGLPEPDAFSYQWIRHDGTIDTEITGATDSTYTLVPRPTRATPSRCGSASPTTAGNPEELTSGATAFVVPPPQVTVIEGEDPVTAFQEAAVALVSNTGVGTDEDFNYRRRRTWPTVYNRVERAGVHSDGRRHPGRRL